MPDDTHHHLRRLALGTTLAALALALASGVPASGGTINSGLNIEPGKTFELGGGQEGGFTVTGRNTGSVAVEVLGKKTGGAAVPDLRGTVQPGGAVDARFAPGEMALLRNTSATRSAKLKLTIRGDTAALGMTYSDNP
ncbi:MAG: hypothetical protein GC147_02055 [Porphyrobacter sp.]|nr:hypothetical protein [Porphyrobacter sp.]